MTESTDSQSRIDRILVELFKGLPEDQAVYLAAVLANRSATELHRRVRAGANERRGTESWGSWAGLQNAARTLVLQSSTCRDGAASLVGRKR